MRAKIVALHIVILVWLVVPLVSHALTLKATCAVPANQFTSQGLQYWGDLVTKRTDGRINFQYFYGGALTKQGEELEAIQRGVADAGFFSVGFYPSKLVLNGLSYAVPFNPTDSRQMARMADKIVSQVPEVAAEFELYNQKLMFYLVFGTQEILSIKPIKTLADMKGLKIAVIGSNMPKWIEVTGAVAIAMGSPERYQALQTKLIDGSLLSHHATDGFKWYEQAKYLTLVNMGTAMPLPVTINMDRWKKLSLEDQKILLDAAKEAQLWLAKKIWEEERDIIDKWKGLGVTVYTLSDNDKKTWAEKLKYVPYDWAAEWDKKGFAATKTLDAYLKAAEEVGYKYPVKFIKR